MKIFEIPVYALSPEELKKKVEGAREKHFPQKGDCDDSVSRITYDRVWLPKSLWEYNHVVGYIVISTDGFDVKYDVYLPFKKIERYIWDSGEKKFLRNIQANGTHFRIEDHMTSELLREKVAKMLADVISVHIPKRYFVDRAAFDAVNSFLDYRKIVEEASHHG